MAGVHPRWRARRRNQAQAVDLATHAYELACRYLGEEDPVTLSLMLRLARLCKAYG